MKNLIKLHIGAHKTATTYCQSQLSAHTEYFDADQHYVGLGYMRKNITPLINNPQSPISELREELIKFSGYRTLILSDENISGDSGALKRGVLYRDLRGRCEKIRAALEDHIDMEVFFSIRDYREFIPSMYCEHLRHNPFCTFDDYLENSNYNQLSWVQIYDDLVSVFGTKSVKLFNFESFLTDESKFMQMLLPSSCEYKKTELKVTSWLTRATLSKSAVDFLEQSQSNLNPAGLKTLMSVIENGRFEGHWKRPEKFSPLYEDRFLEEKYKKELQALTEKGGIF